MEQLLQRYFANELDDSQKETLFDALAQDPALMESFIALQTLQAATSLQPQAEDEAFAQAHWDHVAPRAPRTVPFRRRWAHRVAGYAAAVVAVGLALWGLFRPSPSDMVEAPSDYIVEVISAPGETNSFKMNDGTVVWLGANSVLRYPNHFADNLRQVELTGEAYFDVEPDATRPFVVNTQAYQVKVLGTEFNVTAYKDEPFRTSLVEGSVKVYPTLREDKALVIRPGQYVQSLAAVSDSTAGDLAVAAFSNTNFLSWKEGIYTFDDTPFDTITAQLALYFNTPITIENPQLAAYRFSGKFRQEDGLDSILKTMKKIYGFKIIRDRKNDSITIQ